MSIRSFSVLYLLVSVLHVNMGVTHMVLTSNVLVSLQLRITVRGVHSSVGYHVIAVQ